MGAGEDLGPSDTTLGSTHHPAAPLPAPPQPLHGLLCLPAMKDELLAQLPPGHGTLGASTLLLLPDFLALMTQLLFQLTKWS